MKKIIMVNDKLYVYDFSFGKTTVFIYKDKLVKLDLKKEQECKKDVALGLINLFKKDILEKIKNREYKDINEAKNDLLKLLNNSLEDTDFKNDIEFIKALNELNNEFDKQNENIKQKEQIIEETLDINLKTLFQSHGINEFKINDKKSAIIYEKNGIPHVLTHTNPNTNIYEMVLRSLEFDKLHSKQELDNQIEKSFNVEKDKFNHPTTRNTNEIEDNNIKEITEYLRKNYGINKIYDVMPSNDDTMGESLLIDYGNGWQLLTIERDINGIIVSANLGIRKNMDNEKNVTQITNDIKTEVITDELSDKAKENQIKEILLKLYKYEKLTTEDENVIDYYSDEQNFYKLSDEAREIFLEIKNIYDKPLEKTNSGKTYKKEMKKREDKNAFIELTIITFLSGIITGTFVYIFLKMLV